MKTPVEVTGPINIGNPVEFTMLALAQTVIELTNSRSRIVHRPLPQDDPKQRQPDITKAKELLAWSPRVDLREGLGKTIAFFEQMVRERDLEKLLGPAPKDATPAQ